MSIRYIESTKQIILETANTAYQMKIDELGYLQHLYYGQKLGLNDMSYPFRIYDHGFSGNPYDMRLNRAYSLDSALMKGGYTFPRLTGDYPAMQLDIIRV